MTNALLRLTDGSTTISLIKGKGESGFHLDGWTPQIADYKEGGIWRDSPLASSRRLAYKRWASAIENINLKANDLNQDALIEETQEIRRLLEKASDYWTTNWQDEPVWIEAQAPCETGTRYALVLRGRIPEDDNPFEQPFLQEKGAVLDNLVLNLERGHWLSTAPGQPCADERYETGCFSYYLLFGGAGSNDNVDCGSDPTLDDIPDNAVAGRGQITVHGWVRADGYGESNAGRIVDKRRWYFYVDSTAGLRGTIICGGGTADSSSGLDEFTADGLWHHVLMTYSETGAGLPAPRLIYLAIDGVWVATYDLQNPSAGNYTSDAPDSLYVGNRFNLNYDFDGGIGWLEVRDDILHDPAIGNFSPPPQCIIPIPDASSMMINIFDGGSPTTYDLTINGNDGTITGATWNCACSYSVQVDP